VDCVAAPEDAPIDHAIAKLDRLLQEAREAQLWSNAAVDEQLLKELVQIDKDFPAPDLAAWE
jgi:hypothetical protein